jgi:predicted nucleotidyltransferase component of viral defense system
VLQKNAVGKDLWDILVHLQKADVFKDYTLVGGTALALQIGHRFSVDIDLFTQGDIQKDEIFSYLKNTYQENFQPVNIQNRIVQMIVKEIKVDLVSYSPPLLEPAYNEDGIQYAGKRDLAAMKLEAIANNGTRAKDFVDIYFLLREIPLKNMFDDFRAKYSVRDISYVKRSLVYFDDVDDENWRLINFLCKDVAAHDVKKAIAQAVNEYNATENLLKNW